MNLRKTDAISLYSKSFLNYLKELISSGKKLNVNFQDENGMSSLHQASITGNVEIIKLLVENGAKVDLKDNKGMRGLHYAATHGRLDIIGLLIRCGSNCNEQTFNGDTPLHLAVQSGHADIVYQLLHFGSDIALTNTQYKSSLDLACELGKTKIVEILLQSGLCKKYLKDRSKDLIDSQLSTTCLNLASRNGHNDIIRLLILFGFDVNRFTPQGTALHEACRYGRYQSVKVLLECGIDINHLNYNEQTASDVIIKQKVGNDIKRLIKEYSEAVNAVSIEPYLDNHAGALNFQRDEYITVLEKNPTGHWRGFILQNDYTARYGYFPSNYVKLIDRLASTTSNNCLIAKAAITALNSGKMTRFSSTLSTITATSNPTTLQVIATEKTSLDELTCNISPVGSIDSSSKISLLSNTADSGVGTTSQKSLIYSSPPSSSSRTNTIDRNSNNLAASTCLNVVNTNKTASLMLQSFTNQKPFYLPGSASSPISNDDNTMIEPMYAPHYSSSSPSSLSSSTVVINVSDLLRSGLNESQIIFNWLNAINLEVYYENFVNSGYDLLTIMKMTPSDLCAIGISDPMHRKLLLKQMKCLSIKDLDEQLNQLLLKTKTLKTLLELVHLEQYLELLFNQGYKTLNDLYLINCEDLEEIGIRKLGHQKKFMLIIKRLQSVATATTTIGQTNSWDLYATVRKPLSPKNKVKNQQQLINVFKNNENVIEQQIHQQKLARSLENLSDDNYLLVRQPKQQQQQQQQLQKSQNKPIPPKRTDSIAKQTTCSINDKITTSIPTSHHLINNNQKISNYATLPRKRNLIKNLNNNLTRTDTNQNECLLPFANENIGTIKIKPTQDYSDIQQNILLKQTQNQQQQKCFRKQVIIPPPNCNTNNINYIFNNNNNNNYNKSNKLSHNNNNNNNNNNKNDNVLNDIDCMLSDLNKQLDAMLEYEKAFKN